MIKQFFTSLVLLSIIVPAQAANLELELSQGSQTKAWEVSSDGKFNSSVDTGAPLKKVEETRYSWNLSFTRSTTEVKQQSGDVISDNSNSLTAGAGLETPKGFLFNFDLDYSRTPEENLQSYGPTMTLGYTYHFDKDLKRDDEDYFSASVGAELAVGYENYVQNFTRAARRKLGTIARPTSGDNQINKRFVELSLKASPWSWVSAKLKYTKYSFNKDVNEFLQYLDVHAIGRFSAGMEDALAGFYDHSTAADLYFYILEDWELDLEHSATEVISDGSQVTYDKVMLLCDLTNSWRLGLGAEVSKTSSSTAVTTSDTIKYLSLSHSF